MKEYFRLYVKVIIDLLHPDFNTVKLEQVTFGYKEDERVLKDINLVIEKGKKYLLIGESG